MDEAKKPGPKKTDKSLTAKLCSVCGDSALSCNFGAVTCESCKAFFRRNAQKDDTIEGCLNNCILTRETRSYCKSCRLQKCFAVGMDKNLIWTNEDKEKRKRKIEENKQKRIRTNDDESAFGTQLDILEDPNSFQGAFINSLKQQKKSKVKTKINLNSHESQHSIRKTPEIISSVQNTQEKAIFVQNISKVQSPKGNDQNVLTHFKPAETTQSLPNIETLINSQNADGHPSSVDRLSVDSLDSDSFSFSSNQLGNYQFTSNDENVPESKGHVHDTVGYHTISQSGTVELNTLDARKELMDYTSVYSDRNTESSRNGTDSDGLPHQTTGFNKVKSSLYNAVSGDSYSNHLSEHSSYDLNAPHASVSHNINIEYKKEDVRIDEPIHTLVHTPYSQSIMHDILYRMKPHLVDHTLQLLKACEISFDKVIVQEIKQEPDLADSFNQLEGFIKKTVLFAKNIPAFGVLSQSDQLSLVKGAFLEVMCVWFFQIYNPETRSFRVKHKQPHNPHEVVVTHTKVGIALSIVEEGNKLITGYESLLREYMRIAKGDPAIGICLIAHILFIQRPHLTYTNAGHIKYYSNIYMEILMNYIKLAYPNGEVSSSKLVDLVPKIIKNCGITQQALDRAPISDLTLFTKELFNKW